MKDYQSMVEVIKYEINVRRAKLVWASNEFAKRDKISLKERADIKIAIYDDLLSVIAVLEKEEN